MPARTRALVALAVVAAAGVGALAAPAAPAPEPAVTFGVPRIVDPIHVYGEPDVVVNPKTGAIHASGPQGTGTQRSIWNVSVDGGDSYRVAKATQCPDVCPPVPEYTAVGPSKSTLGPGGGDTEIAIDHNGRVYFNDLYALTCFSAATTDDDGATIESTPLGCSTPGGDRQWMALFDPQPADKTISPYTGPLPILYMEYADQAFGDRVDYTTDGTTYNFTDPAGEYADDGVHNPNHGVPLVDQHTGKFLGLVGAEGSRGLALAIGEPDATGHLTFTYTEAVPAETIVGSPEQLFPILTQDSRRNIYAVWVDDAVNQVYYAWAPPGADNGWTQWSAPIKVNKPPSNTAIFPWAQAAGDGVLDIAWYSTELTMEDLGPDGPSARLDQAWDVYFAQITDADSAKPHIEQVKATPHPMHYNDICLLGTACITAAGNRNQADFFMLDIDPQGRAQIIYTDSSNRLSQTLGNDTAADHQGAALDTVIRQRTGVNAWTGEPLVPDDETTPYAGVTDGVDDALYQPLGGVNVPGADITELTMSYDGEEVVFHVTVAGDGLASAATAGKAPFGQLIVRWQVGDTLYHAGVEQAAAGGPLTGWSGRTQSVDLCSVSGCKPNYLDYAAFPSPNGAVATVTAEGTGPTTYTITALASDVGSPEADALFEEVMAYVAVSQTTSAVPLTNDRAFADEVPVQIEGTRTFNYRQGAKGLLAPTGKTVAPVPVPPKPAPSIPPRPAPSTPPKPAPRPPLPATGQPAVVGIAAVVLVTATLVLRRRLRRAG